MECIIPSHWTGSVHTAEYVRKQILNRFGEEAANSYDPKHNCFTYNQWLENGYQVKKGEKAIKSFTLIEKKDEKGEVIRKYPKTVNLFYACQVEKVG